MYNFKIKFKVLQINQTINQHQNIPILMTKHFQRTKPIIDQEFIQLSNHSKYHLPQILYYPQSVFIDDYFLQYSQKNNASSKQTKCKIIKFVGNEQENIKEIIKSMDSLNQCQNKILMETEITKICHQFAQILQVFYAKIKKIRQQRNFYKDIHQGQERIFKIQIQNLKEKLSTLTKENQLLKENLEKQIKKKQYFERQSIFLVQKVNLMNFSEDRSHDLLMTANQFKADEQMYPQNNIRRSSLKKINTQDALRLKSNHFLDKNKVQSLNASFKMRNLIQEDQRKFHGQIKSEIIGNKR